jgi:hypothetical protein
VIKGASADIHEKAGIVLHTEKNVYTQEVHEILREAKVLKI